MNNNHFKFGDTVILKTFHGTTTAPDNIKTEDNYWKLIDELGIVVSKTSKVHAYYPEKGEQVLIKFNKALETVDLHSHNNSPDSLWVFSTDLQRTK